MCILLVLVAICGTTFQALAEEEPEALKTWRFQGKVGAVEMRLTRVTEKTGAKTITLYIYSRLPRSEMEGRGFWSFSRDP